MTVKQWFAIDSCGGIDYFDTAEEAEIRAAQSVQTATEEIDTDCIPQTEDIIWGRVYGYVPQPEYKLASFDPPPTIQPCKPVDQGPLPSTTAETWLKETCKKDDGQAIGVGGLAVKLGFYKNQESPESPFDPEIQCYASELAPGDSFVSEGSGVCTYTGVIDDNGNLIAISECAISTHMPHAYSICMFTPNTVVKRVDKLAAPKQAR